jgi:hypothetical protein
MLATAGRKAESEYQETRDRLRDLLAGSDAIQILASLAYRFVVLQTLGRAKRDDDQSIGLHHLELAQALALTSPRANGPSPGRLAYRVQEAVHLLRANGDASLLRRLSHMPSDQGERKRAFVLEQMRAHTQVIRGEFYEDQLFRYLDLVLRRLDTVFHRQHGVDAIAVLQVIRSLAELVEDRFNIFIRRQSEIFKKRKPAAAVRKFVELFPELGMTPDEILASLTEAGVRPEHARDALVEFTNTTLTECFTVSRDDIASVCPPGAETSAILQIIDQWSLSFSDLAGQNLDHLHLDNPIWRKPFIRLGDGQLFWPTVTSSSIFAFEMFETLIDPHEPLSIAYHDARAEMLEDELTTLLARYFPAGKVMRQLQWSDPAYHCGVRERRGCSGRPLPAHLRSKIPTRFIASPPRSAGPPRARNSEGHG